MDGKIRTIEGNITAEIEEKRSKFIANLICVKNVEEAENSLREYKKKYHDARHNCYAYIINGETIIKKASDDGEPSGTAGAPILNVLERKELSNVIAIVTRYFGGILLGTGGLVRAYSTAVIKAIEKAKIIDLVKGYEIEVNVNYQNLENLKYYCNINFFNIANILYEENIKLIIEIPKTKIEQFENDCDDRKINIISSKILQEKNIREKN